MPAIQEKEKAFQSMQDSLDKIEKNTSSLGVLSGTLEEIMEENKAQRLRDKEQEKQTKALEKMSGKNAKEGMSTWIFGFGNIDEVYTPKANIDLGAAMELWLQQIRETPAGQNVWHNLRA